jgi:hypothetical protein
MSTSDNIPVTSTDVQTYTYLTTLLTNIFRSIDKKPALQVLVGASDDSPKFYVAVVDPSSPNELCFGPQTGATRTEALLNMVEIAEVMAKRRITDLQIGRNVGE